MSEKHPSSGQDKQPRKAWLEKRRWVAGSLLATAVLSIVASKSEAVHGIPVHIGKAGSVEKTDTTATAHGDISLDTPVVIKVPTKKEVKVTVDRAASVEDIKHEKAVKGPGLSGHDLQEHAPDFQAHELDESRKEVLRNYVDKLDKERGGDTSVRVELFIVGEASDEDFTRTVDGDRNLGEPSPDNEQLAYDRGALVKQYVEQYIAEQGLKDMDVVSLKGDEMILDDATISHIKAMAKQHGVELDEFISDYNHHRAEYLSADERAVLDATLKDNRGARITSTLLHSVQEEAAKCSEVVERTYKTVTVNGTETIVVPGTSASPEVGKESVTKPGKDKKIEIFPFIGFIPPLRRRKKTSEASDPMDDLGEDEPRLTVAQRAKYAFLNSGGISPKQRPDDPEYKKWYEEKHGGGEAIAKRHQELIEKVDREMREDEQKALRGKERGDRKKLRRLAIIAPIAAAAIIPLGLKLSHDVHHNTPTQSDTPQEVVPGDSQSPKTPNIEPNVPTKTICYIDGEGNITKMTEVPK